MNGALMTATRYSFAGGGCFPNHMHDQEQITFVLEGKLKLVVGNKPHLLNAGNLIVIPSGAAHYAVAGPGGAEVLCIVSPARIGGRGLKILGPGDPRP